MKKVKVSTGILAMAVIALSATSCKDTKKEGNSTDGVQSEHMDDNGHMGDGMDDHSDMDHDNMQSSESMMSTNEHSMMSSKPARTRYIQPFSPYSVLNATTPNSRS